MAHMPVVPLNSAESDQVVSRSTSTVDRRSAVHTATGEVGKDALSAVLEWRASSAVDTAELLRQDSRSD